MANKSDTKDIALTKKQTDKMYNKPINDPYLRRIGFFLGTIMGWAVMIAIILASCAVIKFSWGIIF